MTERDPLLVERQSTHGSFRDNAEIYERLTECGNWSSMNAVQRMAMRMIMVKISRVLSGQANHVDHWTDIAGYAKLAEEVCK